MSGASLPSYGSSRAVLIGTATYASRDLKAIPHSKHNVRGLADVLTDRALGGFAARDVRLVDDPGKAQDIMGPVAAAAEQAEDVLLVYYSGHGLLTGAGDLHLSLTESEPGLDWTSLAFSYLAGVVKESDAAVRIVILDACYSGRAHADLMSAGPLLVRDQLSVFKGIYSLTSAPENRTSKAPPGARYSAFTGFLLETVREGVPGAGPTVSLNEVYEVVRRRMRAEGLALPEECGKTGAGAFPFVRNRLPPPQAPQPLPAGVPAPRVTTSEGLSFSTVRGAGYRIGDVETHLREVIDTVRDPDRWSRAAPPYFRTVSGRSEHGLKAAEVDAHIALHRYRPTTFVDALRLVLMLERFTLVRDTGRAGWLKALTRNRYGMADGERLVGRSAGAKAPSLGFTDTHLCVLGHQGLLRVPYSQLGRLGVNSSSRTERVVTVTDLGGTSEDVVVVTVRLVFGHRRLEISEGGERVFESALRRFRTAMADVRRRHPEWFDDLGP
ncbi:caspase family protein [Streptomyces sp. NPDC047976]|uniref:caspase family protein n=1 Tax=Streptomyces sp. NPDC047976 TaxID=3155746 RepID=UPI003418447C